MADKTKKPDGWTQVRFGDVVRLSTDRCTEPAAAGIERYVGLEHLQPGELRIRSWGNVADGVTFTNRFRPGQVLFGKRRAYQRKVAVAEFEGVCSSDIYVFEPADDRLLPALLPFICQDEGFFAHALRTSAGSLSPRTNWTSLADYEFQLPPLSEQQRISLGLNAASHLESEYRFALRSADVMCKAAVDAWVARHLVPKAASISDNKRVPLNALFQSVTDRGHQGLPILAVTVDGEIVPRESLGRHVSDDTGPEKCLRVMKGDLAYNTMRLWQGAIGAAPCEGLLSPAYTVMRMMSQPTDVSVWVDIFRSAPLQHEYRKLVRGIAKDRWRIYFADLATVTFRREGVEAIGELQALARQNLRLKSELGKRAAGSSAVIKGIKALIG